jgi:hypothetical protein
LYKNNFITKNRSLEMLGEDTIPGADYYYSESPEFKAQTERINNNKKPVDNGTAKD